MFTSALSSPFRPGPYYFNGMMILMKTETTSKIYFRPAVLTGRHQLLHPAVVGSRFLRNVGNLPQHYTVIRGTRFEYCCYDGDDDDDDDIDYTFSVLCMKV